VKEAQEASSAVAAQLLAFVEILLLSSWLGSMIFFSFAVAPSAFAVLPTRELAGAVVTSTISKVELMGLVIGSLLILIRLVRPSGTAKLLHIGLLLVMTGAAALSRFWISPRMVSLRQAMGGHIDDVAATDPSRIHFNDLHQYSVGLMSAAMLAGLVVLFLTVRSWIKR
jgi:hypothetical protein